MFPKVNQITSIRIPIPEEYLIDAVIEGITDENIVRTIRSAQIQNSDILFAYLNTLGNVPSGEENTCLKSSSKLNVTAPILKRKTQLISCYNCGVYRGILQKIVVNHA